MALCLRNTAPLCCIMVASKIYVKQIFAHLLSEFRLVEDERATTAIAILRKTFRLTDCVFGKSTLTSGGDLVLADTDFSLDHVFC